MDSLSPHVATNNRGQQVATKHYVKAEKAGNANNVMNFQVTFGGRRFPTSGLSHAKYFCLTIYLVSASPKLTEL